MSNKPPLIRLASADSGNMRELRISPVRSRGSSALALGEASHDLQRVAEDHAVRPVLIVLIELGFVHALGDAVEVGEQIGRVRAFAVLALLRGAQQVIDQYLRMNLFLDVERRRVDDEIAPVLLVLATPNKLGVKVGVAGIADLLRLLLLLFSA